MKSLIVKIIFFVFLLYLILFEFLFPTNRFFPSFSVVWFSINELIEKYNFLSRFVSTFAAVYLTFFISYVIVRMSFNFVISKNSVNSKYIPSYLDIVLSFFANLPFVLIIFLILLWFPDFIFNKYLISLLILLSINFSYLRGIKVSDNSDYFLFYKSLGLSDSFIFNRIIFKLKEPEFFLLQLENHSFIWSVVIISEFIQQNEGIGYIFFNAHRYNDISLMFSLFLFIATIVFVINFLLKIFFHKVYFWS